jgi:hypothetical protein
MFNRSPDGRGAPSPSRSVATIEEAVSVRANEPEPEATRRRLLLGAVTGVVGGAEVVAAARGANPVRDPDGDDGWICATLEGLPAADRITVRPIGATEAFEVTLTPATRISRDGPAAIGAFSIGETILLLLQDDAAVPRNALSVETVYYRVDGVRVVGRTRRGLRVGVLPGRATRGTPTSEIALTPSTDVPDRFLPGDRILPGKPLASIGPGERVFAVGRYDPAQNAFVAVAVQAEE